MTNEEAIKILKNHRRFVFEDSEEDIAIVMAVQALEQKPILDKIRAEIELLPNANPSYWYSGDMVEREDVFDIIDKYKTESEEE